MSTSSNPTSSDLTAADHTPPEPIAPNAASVAIIRAGKVLLIQRALPPYQNLWTLPGGRLEPGETIEQCAAREVREELSLTVYNLVPVTTQQWGQNERFTLAVFATTSFEGQILPSSEIKAQQWITPNIIGALRTTSRLDQVLASAFALFS